MQVVDEWWRRLDQKRQGDGPRFSDESLSPFPTFVCASHVAIDGDLFADQWPERVADAIITQQQTGADGQTSDVPPSIEDGAESIRFEDVGVSTRFPRSFGLFWNRALPWIRSDRRA